MSEPRASLVVGRGGFLGSEVVARLAQDPASHIFEPPGTIRWSAPDFDGLLHDFSDFVGTRPWRIFWVAGSATVADPAERTSLEVTAFEDFTTSLSRYLDPASGEFLFVSSAGGIYAGKSGTRITRGTAPDPRSPYGRLKLNQELICEELSRAGFRVAVFRISNLYGPRRNASKTQGLVHHLVRAAIRHDPVTIFVPLGTIRDYVFISDAAVRLVEYEFPLANLGSPHVEILASGRGISVGDVIALVQRVTHRRIPCALSQQVRSQPGDLHLVPTIEARQTPLVTGIRRTFDALAGYPL